MWRPGQCLVSSSISLHLSFETASHWTWSSPIWLDWLASKPQGFPCLCFPSDGMTDRLLSLFFFFSWFWSSDSGPYACMVSPYRLSHLLSPSFLFGHRVLLCSPDWSQSHHPIAPIPPQVLGLQPASSGLPEQLCSDLVLREWQEGPAREQPLLTYALSPVLWYYWSLKRKKETYLTSVS